MSAAGSYPKRTQFSPLRYPGGKSALFGMVADVVRSNGVVNGTYVEPYAGGAGIALGLLLTEHVERVVINDLDPALYSFWAAVTRHSDEFIELLSDVPLTVAEWHKQREIYLAAKDSDPVALGFATFYLNRTNRSGVLNAGVIGGQDQSGNYKMDARFNRETLLRRCRLIARYASRIEVSGVDGIEVIQEWAGAPKTLLYADPPYFEKGSQLYLNAFNEEDHAKLARALNSEAESKWILTYDDQPEIRDLYSSRRQYGVDVYYSVRDARKASELLVVSDSTVVPAGVSLRLVA